MWDHSDIIIAISILEAYFEKIGYQTVVSHLENRSFRVLVDSNNSLKWGKKKRQKQPKCYIYVSLDFTLVFTMDTENGLFKKQSCERADFNMMLHS